MSQATLPRVPCAVIGTGNIGTDLLAKLLRSKVLEVTAMIGVDPNSPGLRRATAAGLDTSADGVGWLLDHPGHARIVFDATSADAHLEHAAKLADAGFVSVDLTPAKLGPSVVPAVNMDAHLDATDVNLVTCGGQATVPVVHAVSRVTPVAYAEIVSTVASVSAGLGTRQNIDEFTKTTARALEELGGAAAGKAIIVLNPADPPVLMRNTVFVEIGGEAASDPTVRAAVSASLEAIVADVATYVPGYRFSTEPVFDTDRVSIFIEVTGAGDYLPPYAGNLDIMTAAAVRVGERLASERIPIAGEVR